MMQSSIFTQFVLVLAVSAAAAGARAEGRLSVGSWTKDFAKAAKAGDTKAIQKLADFASLDKKITSCDDCDNKSKMAQARKLYAQGKYEEARTIYNEIDKKALIG